MCMTIQVTIAAGTAGDNKKIVRKLELKLNRAKINSSTTSNRNGSATITVKPRMVYHAQAETMVNSFITSQRPKISKGQVKIIVDKETDEEE